MAIDLSDYHRNYKFIEWKGFAAVYVIGPEGSGRPCKIGYALNIVSRFGTIQGSNFVELALYDVLWTPGLPVAARIEQQTHDRLTDQRRRGEWFDIEPEFASKAIWGMACELYPNVKFRTHNQMIKLATKCPSPAARIEKPLKLSNWRASPDELGRVAKRLTFGKE